MNDAASPDGDTSNVFAGTADTVVQARNIHGDVHVHRHEHATVPVARQLPPSAQHFVNRVAELTELDQRLERPTDSVLVLTGMAGAGKTSLAVRWAHRVRDRFPDGQLYVNLRGYDPGGPMSAGQVLDGFLRALGTPPDRIPTGLEAQAGLFRSLLDGRQVLIVLDNARSTEQVRPLLPGSGGCRVVVTSRGTLSGLVAGQGAPRLGLRMLLPDEAVELLRQVIGADRADAEQDAAHGLARRCGYLPLALRVAAGRAVASDFLTLADLNDELDEEHGRLDALTTEEETTAVRIVFSWSYQALGPEAARTFRLLGLHPGHDIALRAVAALTGLPTARTRRQLEALTAAHLLEQSAHDRFQFHDLLRAYAAERAETDEPEDERTMALEQLLDFYIGTADAADRALLAHRNRLLTEAPEQSRGQVFTSEQAARWFESEWRNTLACIRRAHEAGQHTPTVRLASILVGFLELRDHWKEAVWALRTGIDAARSIGDRSAEAQFQVQLADINQRLGDFEEVGECYRRALAIFRQLGDRRGEGYCQNGLGLLSRRVGDFDEAAYHFEEALAIFRTWQGDRGIDAALLNLAITHQKAGSTSDAIRCADEILEHGIRPGDWWLGSAVPAVLGAAYLRSGQLTESLTHLEQALAVSREAGATSVEADVLALHGEATYELGRTTEAGQSWQRALELFESLNRTEPTYFATLAPTEIRARLTSTTTTELRRGNIVPE